MMGFTVAIRRVNPDGKTKTGKDFTTGKMGVNKSYFDFFTRAIKATGRDAMGAVGNEWYSEVEKYIKKAK